jgi:DNA mismatch repair ATPase MutS
MRCPGLAVQTSIHIEDSLRRGVSHFMAELLRIKRIVDAAESSGGGAPVLYLLDEVLHGTNSMERAIATERIMRHLMALGAVGAVTTHDLALFESGALAEAVRHVHFTEQFEVRGGARVMTFDYMLRPGKATSRNALTLLELVGLPSDAHPGGH